MGVRNPIKNFRVVFFFQLYFALSICVQQDRGLGLLSVYGLNILKICSLSLLSPLVLVSAAAFCVSLCTSYPLASHRAEILLSLFDSTILLGSKKTSADATSSFAADLFLRKTDLYLHSVDKYTTPYSPTRILNYIWRIRMRHQKRIGANYKD